MESGIASSKFLIMVWSFLLPALILKLHMNQSRVTSSEQNILLFPQEIPRDVGTLCQEQGQRSNIRKKKDAPSALITLEITRTLGALCQELGSRD